MYVAPTTWTETGLTWANRPALPPSAFANLGTVTALQWREIDVSTLVTGTGTYAFAIGGGTSNTALYSSREGTNPAQLVIETVRTAPRDLDVAHQT